MWAFGTSPHGLGLTASQLWGLSAREHEALEEQWRYSRTFQMELVAALRADLHNTSSRQFNHHFKPVDFMPEALPVLDVETHVKQLIEQGYQPAAACAIATSVQSPEQNREMIRELKAAAGERCNKKTAGSGRRRRQ